MEKERNGEGNPNPDQENGFGYTKPDKPDGFVMIDVESFDPVVLHKDLPSSNSRFTRSVSRKGSGRSNNERKIHYDANCNDKETSFPQSPLKGTPEKSAGAVVGNVDPMELAATTVGSPLHQITITTSNISTDQNERRFAFSKKTSFKRSATSWILDPKKVVIFFATLSSMGSILLIIFTLTMRKSSLEDMTLE